MTRLIVSDAVCAAFPHLRIDATVAEGFPGREPWPQVADGLSRLEADAATGKSAPVDGDPHIASWRAAYRAFGTNPKRERPSVEALRRRLARSARLPRINPAVDCYNLVSATTGVPAGAFDLRQVKGDITVGLAVGTEEFTPLGEPDVTEHPRPGEVIYADAEGVLTRHWNHRDAERTKVTADSDDIVFLLETVDAPEFGALLDAATASLTALLRSRARSVNVRTLTSAHPACLLLAPEPDRDR
jgi:DNA/RNA-binding domain of Phe-tRNA-synthetase-like protein